MGQLAQAVLSVVQSLPEGGLLLTKECLIWKVGLGVYTLSVWEWVGVRLPSTEVVVASSATEANALRPTIQVPTKEVFLTPRPSHRPHLGSQEAELKQGSLCQLFAAPH